MDDFSFDLDNILNDIDISENQKKDEEKQNSEKNIKNNDSEKQKKEKLLSEKKPIKTSKIVCLISIGLVVSFIFFLVSGVFYTNYIRYPKQEEIIEKETGMYALNQYKDTIEKQQSITNEDYLVKEIVYANGNEEQLNFIKSIINTVDYQSLEVNAKNVYGNNMIDRKTNDVVRVKSSVSEGEKVNTYFVDYNSITFDEDSINNLVDKYSLRRDNVDYSNILVTMFCDYISNMKEIPTKVVKRVPNIHKTGNSYVVLSDEDIYLDSVLFMGKDFEDCKMRFTEVVGNITTKGKLNETKDWTNWNNKTDEEKEKVKEPLKYGKLSMSEDWCGAYGLEKTKGTDDDISTPKLGDGSFENPASIGTPVITYVIENEKGKIKKYPIRVEMTEFGVSEDAIDWFQGKNIQNRGYILNSEVQYCYYVFKVTNLSRKTLTIGDNSSLCDKNGNLSARTGKVFGLKEKMVLKPDQSGVIESWGRSTELYKKYVIWGANFAKKIQPVWFRVLLGDLEDKSKDKGVFIINYGTTAQPTTVEGTKYTDSE